MDMQPGAKMFMIGPVQQFTLSKNEANYVFLAQDIGKTPFRSMLLHASAKQLQISTTLIHVASSHLFEETTNQLATKAHYPKSTKEFRALVNQLDLGHAFYISGSPGFIASTKQILREKGVDASQIRIDSFLGY